MTEGSAGEVKIILTLDGVSYTTGMKQARAELDKLPNSAKAASSATRREMEQARGSVMVLGEEIGVHLPRHVQKFIADLPGAARALSAAFDAVAVIAIGAAIVETARKVEEFIAKNEEAARRNREAWRAIEQPMRQTNDELRVTNDKIEDAIAKLEGKPRNGLKDAIDEAIASADALGGKLQGDIAKIAEVMKQQEVPWYQRILGSAGSGDLKEHSQNLKDKLNEIDLNANAKLDHLRAQNATEDELASATKDLNEKRKAAVDAELSWTRQQITTAKANQALPVQLPQFGLAPAPALPTGGDQGKRISLLRDYGASLARGSDYVELMQQQSVDQTKFEAAQKAQDAYKEWRASYNKQLEEQKKLVEGRVKILVGSPVKIPEVGQEAARMQKENMLPEAASRNVVGEMNEDLGRYGERWKAYNDAVEHSAAMQAHFRETIASARTAILEQSGAITKHEAVLQKAAAEQKAYQEQYDALGSEMSSVGHDKSLTDEQRFTQLQQLSNKRDEVFNAASVAGIQSDAQARATSQMGEFSERLRVASEGLTNLGQVLSDITLRVLGDVNSTLMHVLSTPANMMRGQHPWRNLGATTAEGIGTSALQYGEGEAMKLLLGKNPLAKQQHVLVDNWPGGKVGNATGGLLGDLFNGGSSTSGSKASGVGKVVGSIVSHIPGFAAGGIIQSNLPALVGEDGPEIIAGAAGRTVIPNDRIGGGGDTHNWNFNIAPGNDTASVTAAVHRTMAGYMRQVPDMAKAAIRNENARLPSRRRI